jgi:SAM-dependent methyltransferase
LSTEKVNAIDQSGGYQEYAFIADLYDHVIPYRERPDITFYIDAAKSAGGPVLELGCGTGRVLIPTAKTGIAITGLDLSTPMLNVCRKRLRQETEDVQSRVDLVQADMRSFSLEQKFSLATIPFRPFQHLISIKDQLACLQAIHRHLVPEGMLVFDIFNPSFESLVRQDEGQEIGDEPEFTTPDGRRVIRKHKVTSRDRYNQINYVELIYYVTHPNGEEERLVHAFPMRYLFRYEAEHLLERAGFEVEQLYANFEKQPYGSEYPGDLIFVARKRVD